MAPAPKDELFLAYAWPDRGFAARLSAALEARGYTTWDWNESLPGSDWGRVFPAIESAAAFVFVISPAAIRSAICLQELDHAVDHGKRVIPLLREDAPPDSLPASLARLQWISVREGDDLETAVQRLVESLDPDAVAHTRLLMEALRWERTGRQSSLLLRGAQLREAQALLSKVSPEPPGAVRDYLARGEQRARRRRHRVVLTLLVSIAAALLVLPTLGPALPALAIVLGFLAGVGATVLAAKGLGFARKHPEEVAPGAISPERPDRLGPETIFLSYSRSDWDRYARVMVEHLRQADLTVWVDQNVIQGGDDWMDATGLALRTCQRMLLCVTPDALESKFVKQEYRYFVRQNKAIYPVMCKEAELPYELDGIQRLDFDDVDRAIAAIRRGRPENRPQHLAS